MLWRSHKGRLRQIEFGRDGLHLLGRQPLGVQNHGQRITRELRAGEHIDGLELQAHRIFLNATASQSLRSAFSGERSRRIYDCGIAYVQASNAANEQRL
jgi:hypothetical protein